MGFFLTIEGCDGSGKSTTKRVVTDWLSESGIDFIETREPGGTPFAEQIRSLLLDEPAEVVSDTTELLLMFAARCQNLNQRIEPALQAGKVVVCERFTDATYAYQGGGRGIDDQKIAVLEQLVQKERRPDMTLLLDIDPEIGLARVRDRALSKGESLDRIEQESIDFFYRVKKVYLNRASNYPQQYVVIDASKPIDAVEQDIIQAIQKRLHSDGS